ncbi:LOW QUALITY PROTEIN: hypothetical protein IFM47457_03563 [Aspergillus lentulus]|nr:LOW QUALITY PROTEIN: hypothetical protein IFM47457_03563 [Aspergillus lentulus]
MVTPGHWVLLVPRWLVRGWDEFGDWTTFRISRRICGRVSLIIKKAQCHNAVKPEDVTGSRDMGTVVGDIGDNVNRERSLPLRPVSCSLSLVELADIDVLMTIGQSGEVRVICTQTRYSLRPRWDGEFDTSVLGLFDTEAALLRSVQLQICQRPSRETGHSCKQR